MNGTGGSILSEISRGRQRRDDLTWMWMLNYKSKARDNNKPK